MHNIGYSLISWDRVLDIYVNTFLYMHLIPIILLMVFSFQKEKWVGRERMEEEFLIVYLFYTSRSMHMCSKNKLLKRETDVLHDRLLPTPSNGCLLFASCFLTQLSQVPKNSPSHAISLPGTLSPLFPPLCPDEACEVSISLLPFSKTFSGLLRLISCFSYILRSTHTYSLHLGNYLVDHWLSVRIIWNAN